MVLSVDAVLASITSPRPVKKRRRAPDLPRSMRRAPRDERPSRVLPVTRQRESFVSWNDYGTVLVPSQEWEHKMREQYERRAAR